MHNLFKKAEVFKSPISGEIVTIDQVPDPVFAEKMMGEGYSIIPSTNTIFAPLSGYVTMLMDTNHAIGITTADGQEILIHIGIDSVNLKGVGFTTHVSINDKVKQGDPLITVNFEYLKNNCKSEMVIILFPKAVEVIVNSPHSIVNTMAENTFRIK